MCAKLWSQPGGGPAVLLAAADYASGGWGLLVVLTSTTVLGSHKPGAPRTSRHVGLTLSDPESQALWGRW